MSESVWVNEFPGMIVVCDPKGIMLEMNDAAVKGFASDGGSKLIGTDMLACHPQRVREKVEALLQSGQRNVYTIQKNGIKKIIYQSPWYQDGKYAGFVELSLEIPEEIPNFVRG
jgi:transcriptional regulator with PAS, ATPase and Fis domain